MKTLIFSFLSVAFLVLAVPVSRAQSQFSPEAYMEYRDMHRDLSAAALLDEHPPLTTYYERRQYPADLKSVPWFDSLNSHFSFTEDELEHLSTNFFMVSERLGSMDWPYAFINLYSRDLPLFLSSDFILSTLHNSYDAILQTLEWQFLEPNLKDLLHALYDHQSVLAAKYAGDDRLKDALEDVDLYVSVALSLAEGEEYLPRYGSTELFGEVMDAVKAEQLTRLPLFTDGRLRKLDFSQFTPRGHYNKEIYTPDGMITLEDYFRAMMWLGRIDFLLTAPPQNPWEKDWTDEELRRMQLGALLLNESLYSCGKLENLNKHERIITFMVGPDDNLTPGELKALSDDMLSSCTDLFEAGSFDAFMEALNASDDYGQKIMSNYFYVDPYTSDPGKLPVSYKLLGQKFLLDSYVFSEVVYDRIVFEGIKIYRPLPDPLDVMAALGNEDALALLEEELDTFKYASNMAGLMYLIESYDDVFWEQSLYNTWLGAIRNLNPPVSSTNLPYFMQTTAWHQEKLNSQLVSWAQLRHDNILYGKQSYTGGTGCSYPYTYVEPCPELYGRLADFALAAASFFGDEFTGGQLEARDHIVSYYQVYSEIMEKLESIALSELEQSPLSEDELTFLKTMINSYMASGPSITGWYMDLFFDPQKGLGLDYTVADVHTQPTDEFGNEVGRVLHVGNGRINMGVFLAPNTCNPEQYMAYAGPVSSFYYEVQENFNRLTDQEWEEYFWQVDPPGPDRPDWVSAYLLDREGNSYPGGRALEGAVYTGTGEISGQDRTMDYFLLFPNPAGSEAGMRFVLNTPGDLLLEVYDASGRLVHTRLYQDLPRAEHHLVLPVAQWNRGLYLVRARTGGQAVVKELVLQ